MKRIGLLGCGSIGTQIAIAIDTGIIPAKLTHIFDDDKAKSTELVLDDKAIKVVDGNIKAAVSSDILYGSGEKPKK